jgi:hypothetical protein
MDNTHKQFPSNTFDSFYVSNKTPVDEYLKIFGHNVIPSNTEDLYDTFTKVIIDEDTNALDEEFKGADRGDMNGRPPVYFWHIDDEMVFAIPSERTANGVRVRTENSFYTRTPYLISSIRDLALRYTEVKKLAEPRYNNARQLWANFDTGPQSGAAP